MNKDLVRQYYADFGEREWERLQSQEGKIELATTTDALVRNLPSSGRVLDLGGGPGRYAIWLAQRGYRVVLTDLAPNLLDIARERIGEAGVTIEEIAVCDACDLNRFADASFDAVLCLVPFYHLIEPADRDRAADELVRVLKQGGVAFIALMPIYSFLVRTIVLPDERRHLANSKFVRRFMEDGVFLNDVLGRFNAGYGVRPEEVASFFEAHSFQTVELLGDKGFATPVLNQLAEMAQSDPTAYENALRLTIESSKDPSLLGASTHLLYVGRRPAV